MNTASIRQFYDRVNFPGAYTKQALDYHVPKIQNPYLDIIDQCVSPRSQVLDVGCGTGLITNLFAMRYPKIAFTAIDFSSGLDWAEGFRQAHDIQNVRYEKKDFLEWRTDQQYDCVICQGVLHHIPDTDRAVARLHDLLAPGGMLLLAVYHPWGKILKRIIELDYGNDTLYQDQEHHPFETSFTRASVRALFPNLDLLQQWPRNTAWHLLRYPMTFSRNGGLVAYVFQNPVLQ